MEKNEEREKWVGKRHASENNLFLAINITFFHASRVSARISLDYSRIIWN